MCINTVRRAAFVFIGLSDSVQPLMLELPLACSEPYNHNLVHPMLKVLDRASSCPMQVGEKLVSAMAANQYKKIKFKLESSFLEARD